MNRTRLAAASFLAVVAIVLVTRDAPDEHTLVAKFQTALYINPGTEIRAAGKKVGEVDAVSAARDGRSASIRLKIQDAKAWPLPRNVLLRLRALGAISYGGRYVELDIPTKPAGGWLADGDTITGRGAATPVEIDELFNTLNATGRADLKATLDAGGAALRDTRPAVRGVLGRTPAALAQVRAVLNDLGDDSDTFDALVSSTSRVVRAVQGSSPGVDQFVSGAATTFAATSAHARELRQALRDTPSALRTTRTTLAETDATLRDAATLARRLAPGVAQLRLTLPPVTSALRTVTDVAPIGVATLRTVRAATPALNPLLRRATALMPQINSIAEQAAPQVGCLRPYAPEIGGFAAGWASFISAGDSKDKFARTNLPIMPLPNFVTTTPAQYLKSFPSMRYAFPRPPGESSGQPWFIPECGVGPETVDPSKDPEARG